MYINLLVTFPLTHTLSFANSRAHTPSASYSRTSVTTLFFQKLQSWWNACFGEASSSPAIQKPTCESGLACFGFFKRIRQCDGARGAINSLMTNPFFLSPLSLPGMPRNSRWPERNCLPTECNVFFWAGVGELGHMHHLDSLGLMRPDTQTFRDVSQDTSEDEWADRKSDWESWSFCRPDESPMSDR